MTKLKVKHLGGVNEIAINSIPCWSCGEKDDPRVMFEHPAGMTCQGCADHLGQTRNYNYYD